MLLLKTGIWPQAMSAATRDWKRQEMGSPLKPVEGVSSANALAPAKEAHFRLVSPRTATKYNPVILSYKA